LQNKFIQYAQTNHLHDLIINQKIHNYKEKSFVD
jgi:hypothetical protein